jgi:hypothetical protein
VRPPGVALQKGEERRVMKNNIKKKAVRRTINIGCPLITILLLTLTFAIIPAIAADIAGTDKCPNETMALIALLGTEVPKKVTVNELTWPPRSLRRDSSTGNRSPDIGLDYGLRSETCST